MDKEIYLGDAVYVSYDGYRIKLRTPMINEDHKIFIDREVLVGFIEFLKLKKLISDDKIIIS